MNRRSSRSLITKIPPVQQTVLLNTQKNQLIEIMGNYLTKQSDKATTLSNLTSLQSILSATRTETNVTPQ
jgi:hypothetical protein